MTAVATEFSLRQRVTQIMAESGAVDPSEIADKVFASLSEADYRDALHQALRTYVRDVIGLSRMGANAQHPQGESTKVKAQRDHWAQIVAQPIHCGMNGWKALGDCTVEDIREATKELRIAAARTNDKADRYDRLTVVMEENGAAKAKALQPRLLVAALETAI